MTSSGTSEAGHIAVSEAVEDVLVFRQEVHNFVEFSRRMLHRRRES